MQNLRVEFEIPSLIASHAGLDTRNISQEVKRIFALFLYEHGRISLGKTCEIANISQWEFADMNRQLGISLPYSTDDLKEDMERLLKEAPDARDHAF